MSEAVALQESACANSIEELLSDGIKATPPSFVRSILKAAADPEVISFAGGLPNPISFPQQALSESMQRVVAEQGAAAFQYSLTAGLPELRRWIAQRYNERHGLDYTEDDVIITTGSQQALDLLSKVLLDKDDNVAVECPTYLAAIQAFSLHQPKFHPITLIEDGLNIEELEAALETGVKMIYLIPNFQNPTGLTYSLEGRKAAREVLAKYNVVVVEDDPYGELRFDDTILPYIGAGHLPHSVVMGSFSKVVTPGMRTGFILSKDAALLQCLSIAKEASDLHTNVFSQYVIWDYLMHNDLDEHLVKVKDLYRSQAQAMVDAMEEFFPKNITYTRPDGGMFLWVTLPEGVSAMKLFPEVLEKKVAFVPGDPFFVDVHDSNTMRLNYTNADSETIREGIRRLSETLKNL